MVRSRRCHGPADGTYEVTGNLYKPPSLSSKKTACGHRHHAPVARTAGPHHHPYGRTPAESASPRPGDDTSSAPLKPTASAGGLSNALETVRGINDAEPVSCSRSVRANTRRRLAAALKRGSLRHAAGADDLLRIHSQYCVSRINRPDGSAMNTTAKDGSRLRRRLAGGGEQVTRTEYAGLRFYDNRPARVAESECCPTARKSN